MNANHPFACNMNALPPVQRDRHIQSTLQLIQQVQRTRELVHGYEFMFPKENDPISRIGEFILNERLCCAFLEFNLNVSPSREFVSLGLTGPAGTHEFLRAEFSGAFQ